MTSLPAWSLSHPSRSSPREVTPGGFRMPARLSSPTSSPSTRGRARYAGRLRRYRLSTDNRPSSFHQILLAFRVDGFGRNKVRSRVCVTDYVGCTDTTPSFHQYNPFSGPIQPGSNPLKAATRDLQVRSRSQLLFVPRELTKALLAGSMWLTGRRHLQTRKAHRCSRGQRHRSRRRRVSHHFMEG